MLQSFLLSNVLDYGHAPIFFVVELDLLIYYHHQSFNVLNLFISSIGPTQATEHRADSVINFKASLHSYKFLEFC